MRFLEQEMRDIIESRLKNVAQKIVALPTRPPVDDLVALLFETFYAGVNDLAYARTSEIDQKLHDLHLRKLRILKNHPNDIQSISGIEIRMEGLRLEKGRTHDLAKSVTAIHIMREVEGAFGKEKAGEILERVKRKHENIQSGR